jgi:hypothetical protein
MSLFGYPHTVTIKRFAKDQYGRPATGTTPATHRAFLREGQRKVINREGKETVATVTILLEGLVNTDDIQSIEFTNELNQVRIFIPLSYQVLRDFGGNPIDTAVYA